ncbi:RimJ/RimL family protein N-acetyltransferase [Pullulanibacillus pueri]|uniref:N-acetyltransferase n=1 Tax=Pullulanibacillus pueri TaxID=1437324 RepID=A0A8J3EPR8_9BACL|nr:GNAT family N-acetyltransferase [Pullulanibacillus pueri]MBM7683643.1 RimJ/RimL family protein N-acetyltransferase [Pullulanibacillus pueri]GGH87237.1 N-acetyltransferase [Pullulanibacillus pueri]
MPNVVNVSLEGYQPKYREVLESFVLSEEQTQFTALPIEKLQESMDEAQKVVILADQRPVGFFVLQEGEEVLNYTKNAKALLLRAFSINFSEQRKGYAKMAMQVLPEFVSKHFSRADEVVLAVNEKNNAAQQLYKKAGFLDQGKRRMGRNGRQLVLHLPISQKREDERQR